MEKLDFYCENILSGKVAYDKILETENVLAFYHTKPSYKTHIVVIPKAHIADLMSAGDLGTINEIFSVIRQVAIKLELVDFRVISNNGKYQDSKHLHFHVIAD